MTSLEDWDWEEEEPKKLEFCIDSLPKCEWYMTKVLDMRDKRKRIQSNYELIMKGLTSQEESLSHMFESQFLREIKNHIPKKSRHVKTLAGTFKLTRVQDRIEVVDKEALPEEYFTEIISFQVDRSRIKEAVLEDGEQIPGVEIREEHDSWSIK